MYVMPLSLMRYTVYITFPSDEGPTLETLDFIIIIIIYTFL